MIKKVFLTAMILWVSLALFSTVAYAGSGPGGGGGGGGGGNPDPAPPPAAPSEGIDLTGNMVKFRVKRRINKNLVIYLATYEVSNNGTTAAPAGAIVKVYLSADTTLDATDFLFDYPAMMPTVPALASGEVVELSFGVSLTTSYAPGNPPPYNIFDNYLLFVIDADNLVNESDEGNNIIVQQIRP